MRFNPAMCLLLITLVTPLAPAQDEAPTSLRLRRRQGRPVTDATLRKIDARRLKSLYVSSPQVTDTGVRVIGGFDRLTTLVLDSTAVTNDGLKHLATLKNLRSLTIRRSQFISGAGLQHIGRLTELRRLEYDGRLTGKSLVHLKDVKNLSHLEFSAAKLDANAIKRLATFPNLSTVSIQGGAVDKKSMANIVAIRHLKFLTFHSTSFQGDSLSLIGRCRKLRALHLRRVPVTDETMKEIAKLNDVRYLTLYSTKVTNAGIGHLGELEHLEFLNLSFNKGIDDNVLPNLIGLEKLKHLSLESTSVSKKGGAAIRNALPKAVVDHSASRP